MNNQLIYSFDSCLEKEESIFLVVLAYENLSFFVVGMSIMGRGSLVKCLTHNPGVLGSSRTGSSAFFRGSVLGQDTSEPSLILVKPRKDMNNVNCHRDMTEILLKAA